MLGWMILRFGANIAKPFAGEKIKIRFLMERADGVSDGSAVSFRGVNVGRVVRVWRDEKRVDQIWAEGEVDARPPLPAVTAASIRQTSPLGTGANLVLEITAGSGLMKSGDVIKADYVGLDLLPPELKAIGPELTALIKQFRDENVIANINARVTQAGQMIDAAQQTLGGLNQVVGDDKFRADLQASMAAIRSASENAKAVTAKADAIAANLDTAVTTVKDTAKSAQTQIDELARGVQSRLDQASTTLEQINAISAKINDGTGTAGKLINDPKLYAGLVNSTDELNAVIKDVRRLVQQWEQEGVTAKLR